MSHKSKSDLRLIGKSQRKIEGLAKSTGRAVYTDDLAFPGMLHGKILRSPHPHARILSVDVSKAEALPGVHAVVTGADMPVPYGIIPWTPDEYPLCVDRVRYIGDGVAAVAAVDEDTALAALELIDVEYEELPAFFDPVDAVEADGSTPFIHDAKKPGWNGNVTKKVKLEFGDVEELMDSSAVVVEDDYFFEGTTHTPIEPHCAIGMWEPDVVDGAGHGGAGTVVGGSIAAEGAIEGSSIVRGSPPGARNAAASADGQTATASPAKASAKPGPGGPAAPPGAEATNRGKLTVWSATQVPHYLHRELSRVLDVDSARVRVIQPLVGGAFGGKSEPFDLEFCVGALAMKTGRPVKILYTREEVFYAHRGRHPFHMRYRTGCDQEGKLQSVDAKILLDGGAYASFGLVTTYYSGQLLCAPYAIPAYRFDSTRVYTNKPACGPKRGHGSVQPRFAFEVQLDRLAERVGLDPIEFRRRNFIGEHTRTINELRITSNGFLECLEAVERASGWSKKFRAMPFGRGIGVAGSTYISGTNYPIYPNEMPQSAVQMQIDRSGRVAVFSGASEIGQGCDTLVAQIAAEELGIPIDYVRVLRGDTDFTPVDLGAYSSRVTFMLGNAAIDAARKLRKLVIDAVADHWEVKSGEVLLAGGYALWVPDTSRQMPVREAFNLAEARHGALGATGSYNTPKDVHGEYRGGTIGASPAYSFTAHVAEVEVDPDTGVVHVKSIWVAHDCGRALNPILVEGQMEGSAYMGFGEALMEQQIYKDADHGRAGLHDAPSLLDYRIPTALDTPELESLIVESIDPEGPYGAKEAGEGPLHPSIPAIANAIYDAVGVRMTRLPFSAPSVWRGLNVARENGTLGKPAAPSRQGVEV